MVKIFIRSNKQLSIVLIFSLYCIKTVIFVHNYLFQYRHLNMILDCSVPQFRQNPISIVYRG
jgi:hypothetical protein